VKQDDEQTAIADGPPDKLAVRNEGQRLLLLVQKSLEQVRAATGVRSRQTVVDWKYGRKVPAPDTRAKLHTLYGIPPQAWVTMPGQTAADVRQPPDQLSPTGQPTTLEACDRLLTRLRTTAAAEGLLPSETIKLTAAEGSLLGLRHKLELSKMMLEDKLVREHPEWQRLARAIVRVLGKHPAAAKDVLAVLETYK
jgi:hypothetical protein